VRRGRSDVSVDRRAGSPWCVINLKTRHNHDLRRIHITTLQVRLRHGRSDVLSTCVADCITVV